MYFASGQLWYLASSSSLLLFYLNGMVINYCEHVISVKLSQAFCLRGAPNLATNAIFLPCKSVFILGTWVLIVLQCLPTALPVSWEAGTELAVTGKTITQTLNLLMMPKNHRRSQCWVSEGSSTGDPPNLTCSCSAAAGAPWRLMQLLRYLKKFPGKS